MSEDMFPQQLFGLCQATTINKELLLKFVQDKILIDVDVERIMAEGSNFDKAHSLYNLLQRRPLSDKPRIIKNLKDTSNIKAAGIIEEADITRDSASSSSSANRVSLKTDMNEVMYNLNLVMKKMESLDKRATETENMLKTLTNSGLRISRLKETNLARSVEPEKSSVSHSVQNLQKGDSFKQKESPFVLDVSTLPNGPGSIVFDGNSFARRRRRFWVLEKAGTIKFTLVKSDFSPGSRITISGFKTTPKIHSDNFLEEVYINSSTANGTEFTVSGVVVLVTLTSNHTDGKGLTSSFILSFNHERNNLVLIPGRILQPSTFVTEEGQTTASFPENNAKSYENNANHFMLVSRPSGRDFTLTSTFIDTEKEKHYFRGFCIHDDAEKTWFRWTGAATGRLGRVNNKWGQSSTVVYFFSSNESGSGRGYELIIE